MSDVLLTGWLGLAVIVGMAVLVHEPFRWLGLYLGNSLSATSPVFEIVRAMATAMVAALVMRLILFPAGELGKVPLVLRLASMGCGVVLFYASGRKLAAGVFGALAFLMLIEIGVGLLS